MEKKVFVITADVVKSKSYKEIEIIIKDKLDKVNSLFNDTLYTKFTRLKGDEFQAIIEKQNYSKIMKVIRELKHQMGKHKMRIGIGYGIVNSSNNKPGEFGSWEFNGEAFYKARSAIDDLQVKRKNTIQPSTMFKIFEDNLRNEIINVMYFNVDQVLKKWKEENWLMVQYLEQDMTHEEISILMNKGSKDKKGRDSYTKKINRSDWYLVQEIEELIERFIKEGLN